MYWNQVLPISHEVWNCKKTKSEEEIMLIQKSVQGSSCWSWRSREKKTTWNRFNLMPCPDHRTSVILYRYNVTGWVHQEFLRRRRWEKSFWSSKGQKETEICVLFRVEKLLASEQQRRQTVSHQCVWKEGTMYLRSKTYQWNRQRCDHRWSDRSACGRRFHHRVGNWREPRAADSCCCQHPPKSPRTRSTQVLRSSSSSSSAGYNCYSSQAAEHTPILRFSSWPHSPPRIQRRRQQQHTLES